jgi:hypothetical protein
MVSGTPIPHMLARRPFPLEVVVRQSGNASWSHVGLIFVAESLMASHRH